MTGSTLFVVIAGILLLVSKKKGAVAYRWACVFLALGSASVVRASAALIMLLSSFGLRTNVVPEKAPAWLRKGVWTLTAMGLMAINVVDQLLFLVTNFSMGGLMALLEQAAVIMLLLALEPQAPGQRVVKPRLQAVPADGNRLFSAAAALALCYVVFDFVLSVKAGAGMAASAQFSVAMNAIFRMDPLAWLSVLVTLIPNLAACVLLFSANGRKKHFVLALFCLLINRIPGVDAAGTAMGLSLVLAVMWLSAIGAGWNKKLFGRIPVMNAVALLGAVVFLLSSVTGAVSGCGETAANTKASIYREVVSEYESAAFKEAYDKRDSDEICDPIEEANYETVYQKIYDDVYKAAYDASYEIAYARYYDYVSYMETPDLEYVKRSAKNAAERDAENVAENVAYNYYSYLVDGMSYEIYGAIAENAALIGGLELAAAEVYNNKAPEDGYPSGAAGDKEPIYDTREAAKAAVEYREKAKDELVYENEIYAAGAKVVDCNAILDSAFDEIYTSIYNEIYEPCVFAAEEAAYQVLENRKNDVLNNVLNVLLPALCTIMGLLALLLMNLCLTVQEAEKLPSNFKALLDWCYTNVGEKMQRCMKAMGAVYLVFGMIAVAGGSFVAVVFFLRGQFLGAVVGAGAAIVGVITTALNIILTYPMFSFAQLTADIRHIRDNGGMAVAGSVKVVKDTVIKAAPVVDESEAPAEGYSEAAAPANLESVEETIAEMECPAVDEDEFDDLPDL